VSVSLSVALVFGVEITNRAAMRRVLDVCESHATVEAWPVKGKGATLKTRELAAVARALLDALDAANDGQSGGAAT